MIWVCFWLRLEQDATDPYGHKLDIAPKVFKAVEEVWSVTFGHRGSSSSQDTKKIRKSSHPSVADTEGLYLAVGAGIKIQIWNVHTGGFAKIHIDIRILISQFFFKQFLMCLHINRFV